MGLLEPDDKIRARWISGFYVITYKRLKVNSSIRDYPANKNKNKYKRLKVRLGIFMFAHKS
jgi:hypothetical protein